jgi:hypothetical protein
MPPFRNLVRKLDKFFTVFPFIPAKDAGHLTKIFAADERLRPPIPKHVYEIRMQAVDQNINYTLDGTWPTNASGFVLVAGNDPIVIPYIHGRTVLSFVPAAAAARLELQYGE